MSYASILRVVEFSRDEADEIFDETRDSSQIRSPLKKHWERLYFRRL